MDRRNAIRTVLMTAIVMLLSESINCRLIHKISDFDMPMPDFVAECRRGCLMKVCVSHHLMHALPLLI